MWGNPTLFHQAKSIEPKIMKRKMLTHQLRKAF